MISWDARGLRAAPWPRLQGGKRVVRLADHGLQPRALRQRLLRLAHLLAQLHRRRDLQNELAGRLQTETSMVHGKAAHQP